MLFYKYLTLRFALDILEWKGVGKQVIEANLFRRVLTCMRL